MTVDLTPAIDTPFDGIDADTVADLGALTRGKVRDLVDLGDRLALVATDRVSAFDRVLGTRLGAYAVEAAAKGEFGNMVALKTPDIALVPLKTLAGIVRKIPVTSQLIRCAEEIRISLGR